MKRLLRLLVLSCVLVWPIANGLAAISPIPSGDLPGAGADPLPSNVLWYNGDYNGLGGLADGRDTIVASAQVYDDFVVPAGGWTIETVFSNNLVRGSFTSADYSIRSGVSAGNGGTLVASGSGFPLTVDTISYGSITGSFFDLATLTITGLDVYLAPGTYWLNVTPVDDDSGAYSFIGTTSGANAVGTPKGNDGNSFYDSTTYGYNFFSASTKLNVTADFSMGVAGVGNVADNIATIPEPATVVVWSVLGLVAAGYGAWRRKRA